MKFSGSGDEVLKRFYKAYKKTKEQTKKIIEESKTPKNVKEYHDLEEKKNITPQQIEEAKKLAHQLMSMESKPIFSPWTELAHRHIIDSKIEFEVNFRKFPLELANGTLVDYTPDFVLKNHEYNGKRILIEAKESLTDQDVMIFNTFMETYSGQYHLIMIVPYSQLRKFNEIDQSQKPMFNDIWTIDDLDFFIKDLKKYKVLSFEIKHKQKDSRNIAARTQITLDTVRPSKKLSCIGCHKLFNTTDFSQLHCFDCLKYLE